MTFTYFDPEASDAYIESVIAAATDRSSRSSQLAAGIRDLLSQVHLSPRRRDLFVPIEHLLRGRHVLEVGAGCGAVTRYLGETAKSVVAIEGSAPRARVCASRCQDLSNVKVVTGNFSTVVSAVKFDAVISVGCIEYANQLMGGANGFDRMLKRMASMLTDDGLLIIAIENRLGLKYFAGAPEDHTQRCYDGIQDAYTPETALTLGREEWNTKLWDNDLRALRWLYPFPDYKIPTLILSEEAMDSGSYCPGRVHMYGRQDVIGDRSFDESRVWPMLVRNGLAQELANSFLIVAGHLDAPAIALDKLVWEFPLLTANELF